MFHRKLTIVSVIVLLSALLALAAPISSQNFSGQWRRPEVIADGWWPSISVDMRGVAHIAWYGARNGADLVGYLTADPEGNLSSTNDVIYAGTGGYTVRPVLDTTSEGILYAMYRAETAHLVAKAPAERAESAQDWVTLAQVNPNAYYLDMVIDRNNVIHTVSSEQAINLRIVDIGNLTTDPNTLREHLPCAFCGDILYRRSTDGGDTWSSPINLSNTLTGSERMDIFEGHQGRLYVAWSEGTDWYANDGTSLDGRFVYSDDGGLTWSDPIILTGAEDSVIPITQFALTEMRDGSLLAVWRYDYPPGGDYAIYYQTSSDEGVTWTTPERVPYIVSDFRYTSRLDRYELVTDMAGVVHLFAVGYEDAAASDPLAGRASLYQLEFRQGEWVLPRRVYTGFQPEWPTVAVGPRNELHLSWFIRPGLDLNPPQATYNLQVLYSYYPPTLPDNPMMVAFAPTVTPVPRPTDPPQFVPTATAYPLLEPLETNVNIGANQDLYAIETLLGSVLAVGILCAGVLFIFGFRPRL